MAKFHLINGVGDFSYARGVGITNGNFLDFFVGSLYTAPADFKTNPTFDLKFKTKSINGKKIKF